MRIVLRDYEEERRRDRLEAAQGTDWVRVLAYMATVLVAMAVWRAVWVVARELFFR